MKKHGFTLAEVLVTIGIIGVVAALTTPALIQNIGNAKIGPKLAKGKATFETATEMMLTENNSNTIRGVISELPEAENDQKASQALGRELSRYMKISPIDTYPVRKTKNSDPYFNTGTWQQMQSYVSDDGMVYWLFLWNGTNHPGVGDWASNPYPDIPTHQMIGAVYVDINGNEGPNVIAKDVFLFFMFNDGTIRPCGSLYFKDVPRYNHTWDKYCNDKQIVRPDSCTGSIFENGMKIIYD